MVLKQSVSHRHRINGSFFYLVGLAQPKDDHGNDSPSSKSEKNVSRRLNLMDLLTSSWVAMMQSGQGKSSMDTVRTCFLNNFLYQIHLVLR